LVFENTQLKKLKINLLACRPASKSGRIVFVFQNQLPAQQNQQNYQDGQTDEQNPVGPGRPVEIVFFIGNVLRNLGAEAGHCKKESSAPTGGFFGKMKI
jgi:hypothetical protein